MSDTFTIILFVLLILFIFALFFLLLLSPIFIAKKRKLEKKVVNIIIILCVLSLFLGVTWLAALLMSLLWEPANKNEIENKSNFIEGECKENSSENLPK